MTFKNDGKSESNVIQNHFTAYLVSAIRRRKRDLIHKRSRIQDNEFSADIQDYLLGTAFEPEAPESIQQFSAKDYPKIDFESTSLEQELRSLSELDRFVFLAHVLDERDFNDLAGELELSCSAVTARYYRIVKKIKRALEGGE